MRRSTHASGAVVAVFALVVLFFLLSLQARLEADNVVAAVSAIIILILINIVVLVRLLLLFLQLVTVAHGKRSVRSRIVARSCGAIRQHGKGGGSQQRHGQFLQSAALDGKPALPAVAEPVPEPAPANFLPLFRLDDGPRRERQVRRIGREVRVHRDQSQRPAAAALTSSVGRKGETIAAAAAVAAASLGRWLPVAHSCWFCF